MAVRQTCDAHRGGERAWSLLIMQCTAHPRICPSRMGSSNLNAHHLQTQLLHLLAELRARAVPVYPVSMAGSPLAAAAKPVNGRLACLPCMGPTLLCGQVQIEDMHGHDEYRYT